MPSASLDAPENGLRPLLAYLAVCVIWGSTFLAIRFAVETIPPWTMVGVRCLLAGGILTGYAMFRGEKLPGPRALCSAAFSGALLFAGSQAMLAWGELRVPSGQASVLACTVSLFTPLISWLIGASSRPSPVAAIGLLIGFCGVAVLARPAAQPADQAACLVILLSAVSWAVGAAIARRVKPAGSALLGSGLQLLFGGPASIAIGGMAGEWTHLHAAAISGRSVCGLLYLVVMGSMVAFACFGWLVQIWRPERLSTYAFVNPVVALALGTALAGEVVGFRELLAAALILGAVAVVMFGNRAYGLQMASPSPGSAPLPLGPAEQKS